jgi:iron complex outermembrane receptor protein
MGKLESILGIQGMHQTNTNLGEEYLIPDATTNDFGVLGLLIMRDNNSALQAGLRFDNRKIATTKGIVGEEGYLKASINHSIV